MQGPKIILLDGHTTNPGDISWGSIEKLGNVEIYARTSCDELADRVEDARIIISNKIEWSEKSLDLAPHLEMIALLSTGYNLVDLSVADARGITVCNAPAYSTPDVVQHTIALLLETTNHIANYSESVRLGNWVTSKDFTYLLDPLVELKGKTLGIIGMGSIGHNVSIVAQAFGMNVLFENPSKKPQYESATCNQVRLDELLAESDIVTLHCPLTSDTMYMVDEGFIAKMKSGARLINTARGQLVKSEAVAKALSSGQLSFYAADVCETEPMAFDNPLRSEANAILTPHVAWATTEARTRLVEIVAENIKAYLAGHPQNVVNKA